MSDHLKRLNAPDSWHIPKKTTKFITKTAPGPHNANAMPIAVWLRDHMGYVLNMKEVKQVLRQKDIIINGRPCRDPRMGIGIFDIISIPKMGKYFRMLRERMVATRQSRSMQNPPRADFARSRTRPPSPGGRSS
jgi:small subunit ribosomal protein S4e